MTKRRSAGAATLLFVAMLSACSGHSDITPRMTSPAAPRPIPDMPAVATPAAPVAPPASTPARPVSPDPSLPAQQPAALSSARFLGTAPAITNGNYGASPGLSYDFGRLMVTSDTKLNGDTLVYPTRMQGWVQYPTTASDSQPHQYPVVVLLHGMHASGVDSFRGYDYLGETLATNGYVVISIDANDVNAEQRINGDSMSTARAQLVLATLDHFFDEATIKTAYPDLAGKLDRNRIGIMGHSRGGEGVAEVVAMNGKRRGVSLKDVRTTATDLEASAAYSKTALQTYLDGNTVLPLAVVRSIATVSWVTEDNIQKAVAAAPAKPASISLDMSLRNAAMTSSGVSDAALRDTLHDARVELAPGVDGSELPPVYTFKGVFALAPMDLANAATQPDVPLATLLPSCDGDVWAYMGARLYDKNRFGPDVSAPRYQILVRGGNHNWFNTTWTYDTPAIPTPDVPTQDDAAGINAKDRYCQIASNASKSATPAESIRLSAADQRKLGIFVMDSFMRYFVGGEQQFAAYWSGASQVPQASCRAGKDTCDEDLLLTAQRPSSQYDRVTDFSQFLLPPKANVVVNPPVKSTSFYSGFTSAVACESFYSPSDVAFGNDCWTAVMPSAYSSPFLLIGDGFYGQYDSTLLISSADHMELDWSTAGASISTNLAAANPAGLSAATDDTLTFRIANAKTDAQEIQVTLSDGIHPDATVSASDYSDALYTQVPHRPATLPASDVTNRMLLNMVGIPLAAFKGIDPSHLKTLTLTFPQASGTVAVSDVQFQSLNRRSAMPQ